jgi:hypothetical protein
MKGRKARESGLQLKASVARSEGSRRKLRTRPFCQFEILTLRLRRKIEGLRGSASGRAGQQLLACQPAAANVEVKLACAELAWSLEIDLLLESAVRLFRASEDCCNNAKET